MYIDAVPARDGETTIRVQGERECGLVRLRRFLKRDQAWRRCSGQRGLVPRRTASDPAAHDLDLVCGKLLLRRHVRIGVRREHLNNETFVGLAGQDDCTVVTAL